MIVDQVLAQGYLANFHWGCEAGEHCGWVILEAENETQALMVVPPLIRGKARAIRVTKVTREDIESMHESG